MINNNEKNLKRSFSMFKNEYTINNKLIKEYVFCILCKDIIIWGLILSILLFMLFLLDNALYINLVLCFLILLFIIFFPFMIIKKLEDNEKILNNGKIEKTSILFDEKIIMDEGKVHLEFEYSQIKKIKQTKNLIALMINKESAILVNKNGFIKGNNDDFMKFIKEKKQNLL